MTGKIIRSIAGFYDVYSEGCIYRCRARGLFRLKEEKPLVGDDVELVVTDMASSPREGNITRLLPRRNALVRPNVANVDQAVLFYAVCSPEPSCFMLDRLMIVMAYNRIPAVLCFNKKDLASSKQMEALREVYRDCGCPVYFVSTKDRNSIAPLESLFYHKTTVITGPSGTGKSTLINLLCPEAVQETGELSRKIERGRNTTRSVSLLYFAEDSFLVDTPGFTSLDLERMSLDEVREYYPEFTPYASQCRFHGCRHLAEPGCAVKQAVKEGKISRVRYDNYAALCSEMKNKKPLYQ